MIYNVGKRINRNPCRSGRKMAKELNISKSTMNRILKNDLKLTSYKKQYKQVLSAASKMKRLNRCKILLNKIKNSAGEVIIWSDEKIFTVQQILNKQNDRIYSSDIRLEPDKRKFNFRRQKPASLMVWAAVASDGTKSPLVFIDQGVKVNSVIYIQLLEKYVLPWVKKCFGNNYIFTQDGAPPHTSNISQNWCKKNFFEFWNKFLWPPSSPDINPMDFSIWSILESKVSNK